MLTCKICNTKLERKDLRRDGSMLCPKCGQIYWKAAVEKATRDVEQRVELSRRAAGKPLFGRI